MPPPPSPGKESLRRPSPYRCTAALLSQDRPLPLTSSAFSPHRSSCCARHNWSPSRDQRWNLCTSPSNPWAPVRFPSPDHLAESPHVPPSTTTGCAMMLVCYEHRLPPPTTHHVVLHRHHRSAGVTLSSLCQHLCHRLAPPLPWEHAASAGHGSALSPCMGHHVSGPVAWASQCALMVWAAVPRASVQMGRTHTVLAGHRRDSVRWPLKCFLFSE
jgi:hypothetical protein